MKRCVTCGSFFLDAVSNCLRDGSLLESSDGMVDSYQIVSRLGDGGMGIVYKAHHTLLDNRVVAIKMLHRELSGNSEAVSRFFREARAASRVKDEHIIEVIDFRHSLEGDTYLVMEYLDGPSLRDVLDREGALPILYALSIGLQVAEGLQAAHEEGIVHRDLKPENVVLVQREGRERVKMLDFGIAKLTELKETQLTRAGMVIGTPSYMSPEQAGAEPVDHRTDIYALGVVLYEMLTGRCPFEGETTKEILVAQLTQPPRPPRELREEIPRSIELVILHALHKEPDQRPQTMLHLVQELRAAWQRKSGMVDVSEVLRLEAEAGAGRQRAAGVAAPPAEINPSLPGETTVPGEAQILDRTPVVLVRRRLPAGSRRAILIGVLVVLVLGIGTMITLGLRGKPEPSSAAATRAPGAVRPAADRAARPAAERAPARSDAGKEAALHAGRPAAAPPVARHRRPARRPHRARPRRVPAKPEIPPVKGKYHTLVVSEPGLTMVYEGRKPLGRTPLRVSTDQGRTLILYRPQYLLFKLRLPPRASGTREVKLKRALVSWDVMSLSQLTRMLQKGEIDRQTYLFRRDQIVEKREQKIRRLKIQFKLGHITAEQHERLLQAIEDTYR